MNLDKSLIYEMHAYFDRSMEKTLSSRLMLLLYDAFFAFFARKYRYESINFAHLVQLPIQ